MHEIYQTNWIVYHMQAKNVVDIYWAIFLFWVTHQIIINIKINVHDLHILSSWKINILNDFGINLTSYTNLNSFDLTYHLNYWVNAIYFLHYKTEKIAKDDIKFQPLYTSLPFWSNSNDTMMNEDKGIGCDLISNIVALIESDK